MHYKLNKNYTSTKRFRVKHGMTVICVMILLSACVRKDHNIGINTAETSMEHLKPLEICAQELKFNYYGSEINNVFPEMKKWANQVIILDKSCDYIAEFYLKDVEVEKTKNSYMESVSAELILNSEYEESRASAKVSNKITFDENLTLKEKEKHILELSEKTIIDFDRNIRKSIQKYLK